jgi:hypothetical protein
LGQVKKCLNDACTDYYYVETADGETKCVVNPKDHCEVVPKDRGAEVSRSMREMAPKVTEVIWAKSGKLDWKVGDKVAI